MKKPYVTPDFVAYGNLVNLTGVFGVSGADDVFLNVSGEDISPPFGDQDPGVAPGGSIDACAAEFQDPDNPGVCIAPGGIS